MSRDEKIFLAVAIALMLLPRLGEGAMSLWFDRWDRLIRDSARQFGVPWRWIKAVIAVESSYGGARSVRIGLSDPKNVDASKSYDGMSWGLMQPIIATARRHDSSLRSLPDSKVAELLNNPAYNVMIGTKELARLQRMFRGDAESVFRGYNGGPGWNTPSAFKTREAFEKSQRNTANYWEKIQRALATIQARQPGPETEI